MPTAEEPVGAIANGAGTPHPAAPSHVDNDNSSEHLNGGADTHGLVELLNAMQAMRVGDFSVRMSGDQIGIVGKIADTFNDIVAANQRMAQQLERVGEVVGRQGRTRQRVRFGLADGAWGEMESSRQYADRRSALADDRSHPRHRRGGARRPAADRAVSTSMAAR